MLKTNDGYKVGDYESVWIARYNWEDDRYDLIVRSAKTAVRQGVDFYFTCEAALAEAKRLNEL